MRKAKKPQTVGKNKRLSENTNKLDWHTFNFLENLLVFCVMPERNAPPESGVHFRVSPRESDESLCLLFKIDRGKDSLFKDDEIKPDYMVLYAKPDLCLCTIIEMKGRTEKGIKHGIDQIKALHDRLKNEIRDNLPNRLKIKFQAIILSPPNTQLPLTEISKENTQEFTIRPVQYHHKAELFDYISQKITLTEPKLKPESIRLSRKDSFIEIALARHASPKRLNDKFYTVNKDKATNKEGIYINYALPNKESYAALIIDNEEMKIGVKESNNKFTKQIESDLKKLGLKSSQHFVIEKID